MLMIPHRLMEAFRGVAKLLGDCQLLIPFSDLEFHEVGHTWIVDGHPAQAVDGSAVDPPVPLAEDLAQKRGITRHGSATRHSGRS